MYLRDDSDYPFGGGAAAISFGRTTAVPYKPSFEARLRERFPDFELVPDLGVRIFSLAWFRGLATCAGLCTIAWMMSPGLGRPIYGNVPAPMQGADLEDTHALAIAPLAEGARSGRRMAATALVGPLSDTPDRPYQKASFEVVPGAGFVNALQRSGIGRTEAAQVADLVAGAVPLDQLKSGAEVEAVLGRRATKSMPRPLDHLAFRARFDTEIKVFRTGGTLKVDKVSIPIDNTPLRIDGEVGGSFYRSARALGAPAKVAAEYLKTIETRIPVSSLGSGARYTLIADQRRAATGEVEIGGLRLAMIELGGGKTIKLMRWEKDGKTQWLDSNGMGERKGMLNMPVSGARISSTFGMRFHPILHTERMHKGMDLAAPYGAAIHASMDGVVAMAGRAGGYGNFVRLAHADGLATGYGHMSRILVRPGERVHRGDTIGLVGSTGLSTGPHVHFELTRNGVAINPGNMSFSTVEHLAGADLREFKTRLADLLATPAADAGAGEK